VATNADASVPGSAGWWLAQSNEPGERRPRADGITLERIVAAALAVLESGGPEALTMRRVADELDTGAASLYRHVAGREELVVLVVDHVIGSASLTLPAGAAWREQAEAMARGFRAHLLANREIVPLFGAAQGLGPNSMLAREVAVSGLIAAGFSPEDAVRAYLTILRFVVVSVQFEARSTARTKAERRTLRKLFRSQDPAHFPTVVALADLLAEQHGEDEFEFGLRVILDGLGPLHDG
jgi:AcrR family transcriptional regulator